METDPGQTPTGRNRGRFATRGEKFVADGAEDTRIFKLERRFGPVRVHLVATPLLILAIGFGLGALVTVFGWNRPPSQAVFITLAGLGGVLLIAYTVAGIQVLAALQTMIMNSNKDDADTMVLLLQAIWSMPAACAAIAIDGAIGTACAVALIDAPLRSKHWWLMSLTGVSILTIALLAFAVALSGWVASTLTFAGKGDPTKKDSAS
jgi:hypothetical protein